VGDWIEISSQGLRLAAYFAAGEGAHRHAVVICHGYPNKGRDAQRSGKSFPQLVDRLSSTLGWDVMMLNFRGCGASEGNFSMLGWIQDVRAAIAHLTDKGAEQVWLVGFGTGGSICITEGAENERVSGVAAFSAPADFDDWAGRPRRLVAHSRQVGVIHDPEFPPDLGEWARGFAYVRPIDRVAGLAERPLLLMHGTADDMVPTLDALAIADSHGHAELRLLAGGGHELRHDPRAIAILIGWLRRRSGTSLAGQTRVDATE